MSILTGFTIIKNNVGTLVKNIGTMNADFKVHTMRILQKIVFEYWNVQRMLLSSPPGSGKSAMVKFIVSWLLKINPDLKVIIVVPYLVLTKSFGSIILEYPDGKQIPWDIDLNLCVDTNAESKVDELNNFLTRKTNIFARVAIASHRTLALLNEKYPDNNYDNMMFIIDEAHHVLYPEEGNESDSANKIGRLIHSLFEQNNPTVKIWFLTATFYRGDKYSIIPPGMMETFTTYHLPLDEYWDKYLEHIKTFEYNFVIYKKNDVFNEISEIFRTKGKRKTIVYCPYNGHVLGKDNKLQFRDKIIKAIRKVWPDCRILDLVQVEGRGEIKDIVIDNVVEFDVVLAVKLFDEGTDWEQAESIIDLSPSNSLRIQVQRFGRLIRDYPGKIHIDYNVFFPYEADFKDDEERRVHMSKCFNAFVASCLLHNAIEPVPYPKPVKSQEDETKPDSGKPEDCVRQDPLSIAFPDESQKQQVLDDVFKRLGILASTNKEPTSDEAKECIFNSLKKLGVTSNFEDIAIQIVRMFDRATNPKIPKNPEWANQTTDVEFMIDAGFDKVWNNEILGGLLAFTTSFCGVKDFEEFRRIYVERHTPEEAVKVSENLSKENNGLLPTNDSLTSMGYQWIVYAKYRYPKKFQHIQQEMINHSIDEGVITAENLAKENNGELQPAVVLKNMGYYWLVQFLTTYPERFSHIKRQYLVHTLDEGVITAENLAKDNQGILPAKSKLKKMGYNWLVMSISKYPNSFSHIKQEQTRHTLNEAVITAENLAKDNQGILPAKPKLKKMGYNWLVMSMIKYPNSFSHIKQDTINQTSEETVKEVKLLAIKNGGILYSITELMDMKLSRIVAMIRIYPDLFKGIKQYVRDNHGRIKGIKTIGEPDAPLQTT